MLKKNAERKSPLETETVIDQIKSKVDDQRNIKNMNNVNKPPLAKKLVESRYEIY